MCFLLRGSVGGGDGVPLKMSQSNEIMIGSVWRPALFLSNPAMLYWPFYCSTILLMVIGDSGVPQRASYKKLSDLLYNLI